MPNVITKHEDAQIQDRNEKLWRQAKAIVRRGEGKIIWPKVVAVYTTLKRKQEEKLKKQADTLTPIILAPIPINLARLLSRLLIAKYITLKPSNVKPEEREILLKLIDKIKNDQDLAVSIRNSMLGPHLRYLKSGKKRMVIPPEFKKNLSILAHEYGHTKGTRNVAIASNYLRAIAGTMSFISNIRALQKYLGVPWVAPYEPMTLLLGSYIPRLASAIPEITASHRGGKLLFQLAKDLPLKDRIKLYIMTYRGVPTYLI